MEAELKFERENRSGIGVVGSYLIDAARRLGVEIFDDCGRLGLCDSCAVTIKSGAEFLSEPTKAEIEQLSEERRNNGERLSCQAKIAKEGEIVVVTHEKKEEKPEHVRIQEEFRRDFDSLPLGEKVSRLMELEAVTLSETFSFILNSPYTIGGKLVEFLSGFGIQFEKDDKDAKRPDEHKDEPAAENGAEPAAAPEPAPDLDEAIEAEEKRD